MWTIVYRNKESGKRMWECGFEKYMFRRVKSLLDMKVCDGLKLYIEHWTWKNFIACLFRYSGAIDEESIAAEGKVE